MKLHKGLLTALLGTDLVLRPLSIVDPLAAGLGGAGSLRSQGVAVIHRALGRVTPGPGQQKYLVCRKKYFPPPDHLHTWSP